ncbi:MAG: hypothetical protein MUF48_19170 [Pirellulaceae bacterium]|nr:hypothetical protein [Pirellulaceae bacterium]
MKEYVIQLTHRPGELVGITNLLSPVGVNLKSVAAMAIGDRAIMRFIPDDAIAARNALSSHGVQFEEHEVVVALLENKAGELTGVAATLAEAGINLLALYVVGVSDDLIELAIICDDPKKARKLLE